MREILFRGFAPDENGTEKVFINGEWIKGKWVEGFYFEEAGSFIKEKPSSISTPTHLVIPETVGQYTGLTDRNGKKIFEGDIVRFKRVNALGYTTSRIGVVKYYDELPIFYIYANTGDAWDWVDCEEIEIIGNIHSNPELLKGEAE